MSIDGINSQAAVIWGVNVLQPTPQVGANPLTSLFQLEIQGSFGAAVPHETYDQQLFFGRFGADSHLVIKKAQKGLDGTTQLAEQEIKALGIMRHCEQFQTLVHAAHTPTDYFLAMMNCGNNLNDVFAFDVHPMPAIIPQLCDDLLSALNYMRENNIMHRDISCKNTFLMNRNDQYRIKIGGMKHAILGPLPYITRRSADIPLDRLEWTYYNYGSDTYSSMTELFLMGCIMNCLTNNCRICSNDRRRENDGSLEDIGNPENATTDNVSGYSWQRRAAVQLTRTIMSARVHRAPRTSYFTVDEMKKHFLFWSLRKIFQFVITCYDYLDGLRATARYMRFNALRNSLNQEHEHLFLNEWTGGWLARIELFELQLKISNNFNAINIGYNVFSLMTVIRNRAAHHHEDSEDIRIFFSALPEAYIQQWFYMFPGLLPHLVRWVLRENLHKDVPSIREYFSPDSDDWNNFCRDATVDGYPIIPLRPLP